MIHNVCMYVWLSIVCQPIICTRNAVLYPDNKEAAFITKHVGSLTTFILFNNDNSVGTQSYNIRLSKNFYRYIWWLTISYMPHVVMSYLIVSYVTACRMHWADWWGKCDHFRHLSLHWVVVFGRMWQKYIENLKKVSANNVFLLNSTCLNMSVVTMVSECSFAWWA